jgi:ABC transporter with metal-binding/Fe-S-binding domain ATP-binding protein
MKLAALCSGGKDSTYALWLALRQGHELVHLVAMQPAREDSWMFHHPNIHLMDLFSECVGLPLVKAETSGVKEQELEDLKETLRPLEVEGVVSGAIASTYQKSRINRICKELGLKSLTPLWGREPLELLEEMLAAGFEIIVTSVSAEGFHEEWLGRKIDRGCLEDLRKLQEKFGVNPSGEGGEYESLVLDAPFFRRRIEPLKLERIWQGDSGHLIVSRARLGEKR